jgi:hypothetical protein
MVFVDMPGASRAWRNVWASSSAYRLRRFRFGTKGNLSTVLCKTSPFGTKTSDASVDSVWLFKGRQSMTVASGPDAGGGRLPSYPPGLRGLPYPRRRTIDPASDRATRAAQYVRMSTEHQRYSTENQADAIRKYAEQKGWRS